MIFEYAYLYITPGREEEFERAFRQASPLLLAAEGCTSADLHRDAEASGRYLVRVGWESLSHHLDLFPDSENAAELAKAIEPYFAKPPELRHFEA
ncbi:antibiotic biosynthesis monooxygenase family protein [Nonomuraea sp. NPDC059023]|uniref:antibiotic biosynthesis monooxygenase family protein n=1 Tax=unclassified Nonomuraea TaxID=2593643 RepID=UPI00369AEA8B